MADPRSLPPEDLQLGELLVSQGLVSRERADECLSFLSRLVDQGVSPLPRLGEILGRQGYLAPDQAQATLRPPSGGTLSATALPAEVAEAARDPARAAGKHVKIARLGAGGMGEVRRAWDRELRRWVALKFLHHEDPEQLARFRREAQTAAALSHPNIASVYEVGDADGKPYIAMQGRPRRGDRGRPEGGRAGSRPGAGLRQPFLRPHPEGRPGRRARRCRTGHRARPGPPGVPPAPRARPLGTQGSRRRRGRLRARPQGGPSRLASAPPGRSMAP